MFILFEVVEGHLDIVSIHPILEEAMTASLPQTVPQIFYHPSFMIHEWNFGEIRATSKWYRDRQNEQWKKIA